MTTVPKCRSKAFPCPAGDRCPQHRGMLAALREASNSHDITKYLDLKERFDLTDEEKNERNDFLSQVRIKQKRSGETVITLPRGVETATSGNKITVPPIHPADAVDKRYAIRSTSDGFISSRDGRNYYERMEDAINETYNGNVKLDYTSRADHINFDKLDIAEDYKGKGVEEHVIKSVILDSRIDLYDFFASEDIPDDAAIAAGFEPNPYYWAGKTHPISGVTYPSKEELSKLNDWDHNPNASNYSGLYSCRYQENMPWVRLKYGVRINDVPMKAEPEFSKEKRLQLSTMADNRYRALEQARFKKTTNF